jgi:hypothetical protein
VHVVACGAALFGEQHEVDLSAVGLRRSIVEECQAHRDPPVPRSMMEGAIRPIAVCDQNTDNVPAGRRQNGHSGVLAGLLSAVGSGTRHGAGEIAGDAL